MEKVLVGHFLLSLRTFPITLKHNTMQWIIQNTAKTFHHINTAHCALFLHNFLRV